MRVSGFLTALVLTAAQFASAREAVVFVGAHPDDSEGFAATAFLLRERYDVHVVDLTRGELGLGMAGLKDGSTAKRRMAEEAKACAFLGATPHFLDEVDGFACAGEKSVDRLAGLFKQHKPKAVFTHWPVDAHADHRNCSIAAIQAARSVDPRPELYFFEVLMAQTHNWHPIYSVDVSSTMSLTQDLLRKYACQNENDELVQVKTRQAALRGSQRVPAAAYAETFTTFDGKPLPQGVLAELKQTAVVRLQN